MSESIRRKRELQELCVAGFIRESCSVIIPDELMRLCLLMYLNMMDCWDPGKRKSGVLSYSFNSGEDTITMFNDIDIEKVYRMAVSFMDSNDIIQIIQ